MTRSVRFRGAERLKKDVIPFVSTKELRFRGAERLSRDVIPFASAP